MSTGDTGRLRALGAQRLMGTATYGGNGFNQWTRVSGEGPIGAASCRQQSTQASCQAPPPPTPHTHPTDNSMGDCPPCPAHSAAQLRRRAWLPFIAVPQGDGARRARAFWQNEVATAVGHVPSFRGDRAGHSAGDRCMRPSSVPRPCPIAPHLLREVPWHGTPHPHPGLQPLSDQRSSCWGGLGPGMSIGARRPSLRVAAGNTHVHDASHVHHMFGLAWAPFVLTGLMIPRSYTASLRPTGLRYNTSGAHIGTVWGSSTCL